LALAGVLLWRSAPLFAAALRWRHFAGQISRHISPMRELVGRVPYRANFYLPHAGNPATATQRWSAFEVTAPMSCAQPRRAPCAAVLQVAAGSVPAFVAPPRR
jgi:hypothetical protein